MHAPGGGGFRAPGGGGAVRSVPSGMSRGEFHAPRAHRAERAPRMERNYRSETRRAQSRTLDRSRLWAVQTPQVFRRAALEQALESASDELLAAATDDAWLIEQGGGVVRVVDAGAQNIKVTNLADLRLAELLLAEREHGQIG